MVRSLGSVGVFPAQDFSPWSGGRSAMQLSEERLQHNAGTDPGIYRVLLSARYPRLRDMAPGKEGTLI